jgi:hypothetical protein
MKLCASCQNKYPDDANFCPREECATPEGPHRLILLAADGTTDASSTESPPAAGAPAPGKAAPPARFVLVSRIGGGPSGEVWQASDAQTGAAVAYKAVAPGSLPTQIMMDRAMRELRQLQRTSSPRIVKVVDFGKTDDGAMYVASELASGEPLDQIVARSGPFPLDRAKRIVAQVGEALLDAQKVGVVHRDLSAKNVLVAGDDEVRIINFAIARPFSETVCGVPEFMSPEQADGKLIDQRSNTYSLGALIYYMLTGQPPFVGASPQATIEAIHKGELVPPSIKRSGAGLTAEVDRVVLKALERSSSRRPLTLRQFLADVAALVVSEQTATTISTPSGKEPAFVKTMMFAGGSQEVQKLVAQAVAARDAAAGGSPAGPGAVIPNPTTVGMGPPPPRLPTPVPLTGGRPTGAGLPSGTPGPAPKEGAPRPSHGAAIAQTMIAMPAATGVPVPGSSGAGAGGGVASTATEGAPGSTTAGAPEAAGGNSAAAGAAAPGSVNFRETLWFKRGDVDQMVADARAKMQAMAEAKGEGKKPSGEVGPDSGATAAAASAAAAAETKPLEDRYVDDGTLTADDRKNFSLRRGSGPNATMNARAGDIPGERMSETEVIDEIGGRKRIKIFGIVAAVTAALVVVIVVMARGKGKGDGQKPAAAATTAGAPVAPPPPPVAPPPPAPARGDEGTAKEAEGTGGGSKPATAARRKAPAKKKQASPAPAKTSSTTSKKKKEPTK